MTEMRSLFGPEMQSGVINFCFLKIANDAAAGIIDISVEAPIFTHSQTIILLIAFDRKTSSYCR